MNPGAYRDLQLLTEISSSDSVTQRGLAKRYGLALGLTNFLIRRLVTKGYVKIVNLERKRLQYLITPRGLSAKARLTYEYLEYSLYFYREIRAFLSRALSVIGQSSGKRIVLYGVGEVAEVAFLILQQSGVTIAGIVGRDGADGGRPFLNQPVRTACELPGLEFDWVVVAAIKEAGEMVDELVGLGVDRARILAVQSSLLPPSSLPPPGEAMSTAVPILSASEEAP